MTSMSDHDKEKKHLESSYRWALFIRVGFHMVLKNIYTIFKTILNVMILKLCHDGTLK